MTTWVANVASTPAARPITFWLAPPRMSRWSANLVRGRTDSKAPRILPAGPRLVLSPATANPSASASASASSSGSGSGAAGRSGSRGGGVVRSSRSAIPRARLLLEVAQAAQVLFHLPGLGLGDRVLRRRLVRGGGLTRPHHGLGPHHLAKHPARVGDGRRRVHGGQEGRRDV